MVYQIAIDGPAGSGKSTIAELLKKKLGYHGINSGNIYRAVTYVVLKKYPDVPLDKPAVIDFIEGLSFRFDKERIFYNECDITNHLRTKKIDLEVSNIAKPLYIRNKVHKLQQKLIEQSKTGIIIEGRDIGTNILPNATLKIYLTASPEVRATRRHQQRPTVSFEDTLADIKDRDFEDINRKFGPLIVAPDAIIVDTDNLTIEMAVDEIYNLFLERTS